MKHTLILVAIAGLLACNDNANKDRIGSIGTEEFPLPTRDHSISANNAYSDIFFDSTAVEKMIARKNIPEATAKEIRNFYNVRNYQSAWFASNGLTGHGKSFWNLQSDIGETRDSAALANDLVVRIDSLAQSDSVQIAASDSAFLETEIYLTSQLVRFAADGKLRGAGTPGSIYYLVPAKKMDALQMADSLLKKNDTAGLNSDPLYQALKQQLAYFVESAKKGSSDTLQLRGSRTLKKGMGSVEVIALKKHLRTTGDLTANDTTDVFNDSLDRAVRRYQQRIGFKVDGIVTDSLVKAMNKPPIEKVKQILVNMDRMKWMPRVNDSTLVQVNIPSYILHVKNGDSTALKSEVVVGKEGMNTMMFAGDITTIVFNPTWNIPESIVRDEIMPAMEKDPGYLKKKNMEIVSNTGSIPVIRPLPGKDNAMGRIKFLIPNRYDIYLHDTPDKSSFNKDRRDFSHGCIRVADAEKLAAYLLSGQREWSAAKIKAAISSGKEQSVKVTDPTPVMITYLTVWADDTGNLIFLEDVYGLDKRTAERMFS